MPNTLKIVIEGHGLDMTVETANSDPLAADLLQLLAERLRSLPDPETESEATP